MGRTYRGRTYRDMKRRRAALRMLMKAQGRRCAICGRLFFPNLEEVEPHWLPSIDHVIPSSVGGPDRLGNFLAAHRLCNSQKGERIPTGCEIIWLLAMNCKLGVKPDRW